MPWVQARLSRGATPRPSSLGGIEAALGGVPDATAPEADPALAALPIPVQNALRLEIGWRARLSRTGDALGDLAPDRFRNLVRAGVLVAIEVNGAGSANSTESGEP